MHTINNPTESSKEVTILSPLTLSRFTDEEIVRVSIFWNDKIALRTRKNPSEEILYEVKRYWEKVKEAFKINDLDSYLYGLLDGKERYISAEGMTDPIYSYRGPSPRESVNFVKKWIRLTELDKAIAILSTKNNPISEKTKQFITGVIERELYITRHYFCVKQDTYEYPYLNLGYFMWGRLLSASLNWNIINNKEEKINYLFEEISRDYSDIFRGSQIVLYNSGICSEIGEPTFDLYKRLLQNKTIDSLNNFDHQIHEYHKVEVPFFELYLYSLLAVYDNHKVYKNPNKTDYFKWLKSKALEPLLNKHTQAFGELKALLAINGKSPNRKTESIVYLMNTIELVSDTVNIYRKRLRSPLIEATLETPQEIVKKSSVNYGKALPPEIWDSILNEVVPLHPWLKQVHDKIPDLKAFVRAFLLDENHYRLFPEGIVFSQSIFERLEAGATLEEIKALREIEYKAEQNDINSALIWKDGTHYFLQPENALESRVIRKSEIYYREDQYKTAQSTGAINTSLNNPSSVITKVTTSNEVIKNHSL